MDTLSVRAPLFYTGMTLFADMVKRSPELDVTGKEVTLLACRAKHRQDALKNRHLRRGYSESYLTRSKTTREVYLNSFDNIGPRWVQDCNKVSDRIKHVGWFTDDYQDSMAIGVVLCLTRHGPGDDDSSRGGSVGKNKHIYIAGVRYSDQDGVTLNLNITGDSDIAARWADKLAERLAGESREADQEYQAEELRNDIAAFRADCLKLLRTRRSFHKGNPDQQLMYGETVPVLSATWYEELREKVTAYRKSIAVWRTDLEQLTA